MNYLTPIFHYIVSEYFPVLNFGSRAVEFADSSVVRDNRLGLIVHGQLCCVRYCCLVFQFKKILPFSFSEVETASEMTKTMLEWMFYLLTLVNIAFVNWPCRTVHTVTESKTKAYIWEFREHCSLPLWHVRNRSYLGPELTKFHLRPGSARTRWGSLQRSPDP